MKKVVITIYGKDYAALSDAASHAATQLWLGAPSEYVTFEDDSQVDYTVVEDATEEWKEKYGDDPKEG